MPVPLGGVLKIAEKHVEDTAKKAEKIMKDVINKKTGALSDSVSTEKKGAGSYLVGVDEAKLTSDERNAGRVNYVGWYYNGTKPHTIRAKNGGTLHWKINGRDYFAKKVKHPGTKPHDFLGETISRLKKEN